MVKRLQLTIILILALASSASAQKKDKMLSGVIIDEYETRISEACISDSKGNLLAITNCDGVFQIPLTHEYNITISHPRFKKATVPVDPKNFELIDGKY